MYNYFVLHKAYESFLKLNELIEKYGYIFESFDYYEVLSKFDRVISHGAEVNDPDHMSRLFFIHPMFDFYTTGKRPMIFLRSLEHIELRAQLKGVSTDSIKLIDSDFVNRLINVLRLYKHGMIELIMRFSYDIESKKLGNASFDKKHKSNLVDEYCIDEEDLAAISQLLDQDFKVNDLSRFAFESFNLSYTIENKQLRYVTLMTALESIFNSSRDQIAHTLSRHLSILVSQSKEDFSKNYKLMKKLYGFRSAIVHGSSFKEAEMDANLLALEDMVRKALNKTISIEKSKDELFIELNAKGYS